MTEKYLTAPEAASILRVPPSTLHYWRGKGAGPRAFKLGRRLLYRESDLQAYVDAAMSAADEPSTGPHDAA